MYVYHQYNEPTVFALLVQEKYKIKTTFKGLALKVTLVFVCCSFHKMKIVRQSCRSYDFFYAGLFTGLWAVVRVGNYHVDPVLPAGPYKCPELLL